MNVLSIMAHQDDEMRCLGTMLKCRARGGRLFFIVLTDGSTGVLGGPPPSRQEASRIGQAEISALAGAIETEYICLAQRDAFLYDTPEVRSRLIEAIRSSRRQQNSFIFRTFCFFLAHPSDGY